MRIAIVNDDLIQHGGQENVLEALLEAYPGAILYSSFISTEWKDYFKSKNILFCTSFMDKLPFVEKIMRYYSLFFFQNIAYESFDFSNFDLVISNSSRFAHHIITKPNTTHICYMHSPGRMFWLSKDYFKFETFGLFFPLKKIASIIMAPFLALHRIFDYTSAQRVDHFIANSSVAKGRIQKFYRRNSIIVFPFVNIKNKKEIVTEVCDYYLVLTRLIAWKRVDLAIQACIEANKNLKIIGVGPDMNRLKKIADNNPLIEFLGSVSEDVKFELLGKCRALIQTQYEDFGIVPLEVNCTGKVVIGFGQGGLLDTMIEGKTSEYFKEQTSESIINAINKFESNNYSREDCINNAARFDKPVFIRNMVDTINSLLAFPSSSKS